MSGNLFIPASVIVSAVCQAAAQPSSLPIEISADHPLLLFAAPGEEAAAPAAHAAAVLGAWEDLPEALRPFAVLVVRVGDDDFDARQTRFQIILSTAAEFGIPVAIEIADGAPSRHFPPKRVAELLHAHSLIKGVYAQGLRFAEYYHLTEAGPGPMPPDAQWLLQIIETAAGFRRFVAVALDELHWPRMMSSVWCKPLFDALRQYQPLVIPLNLQRGDHNVARTSALLGLWLEGAVEHWGVVCTSGWYRDARFIQPGVFGVDEAGVSMPPELYAAMLLNGAMTGATVYYFADSEALWRAGNPVAWNTVIQPILLRLIEKSLIARKDIVARKTRAAYRLAPSRTGVEFHHNLVDLDPILDEGNLVRGTYGVERPGQVPELVLNTGRWYWIPVLSPHAPKDALAQFDRVFGPGDVADAAGWEAALGPHYAPDGAGSAFISRVGRAWFIMHTRENLYEAQTFRIPDAPAPVRGIRAERTAEGVQIQWPFREGDVFYEVHRRTPPSTTFERIARDLDGRRYVDTTLPASAGAAYSVTTLTNEREPFEGTVNYGDYWVVSAVESRIIEEVVLEPDTLVAEGQPLIVPNDPRPPEQSWWPNVENLAEEDAQLAKAIAARIEQWEQAVVDGRLDEVMDVYARDYRDPEGWGFEYAKRAFKWYLERYRSRKMDRQIRRWDFTGHGEHRQVQVLLYCRFSGVALTDSTGRFADLPMYFPLNSTGETWITFTDAGGPWRILSTNPAVPNFNDILSYAAGPDDGIVPGPDN